jgi:tRNA C32,U32 (ribose-2'-O)-methylase TrmJ
VREFLASAAAGPPPPGARLALVFGREELGLAEAEVAACDAVCSIPIGRLQESLSLSHAVNLALAHLFEQRLACAADPGAYSWRPARQAGDDEAAPGAQAAADR